MRLLCQRPQEGAVIFWFLTWFPHRTEVFLMMTRTIALIGALLLAAALTVEAQEWSPEVAQSLIYLNSQPGDWVGQGQQLTFTPADGAFTVQGTYNSGVQINFNTPNYSHFWFLDFGPPTAMKFTKGEYEGAQRFAFHSPTRPGIDVSGDGRGCNRDAGRFLVSELVFAQDGTVDRLAIDFEQHCEGSPPALYGSVRYNSAVPLSPRVSVGNATTLKGNTGSSDAIVTLAVSMPSSSPVSVQYSTQDGSGHQGIDYTPITGTVTFGPQVTSQTISVPVLGDRLARGNKIFHMKLSQPTGAALGDALSNVGILDPNISLTALTMYGQPGDYINSGQLLVSSADGTFTPNRNFDQGVSFSINNSDFWNLDFAAPNNAVLVPGDYENAQRFPFQPSGVPGLSVSGAGRGCNTLTGRFSVLKAKYDASGNVKSFAADFEQHCEGASPALAGSIRYKSKLQQISVSNAVIANGSATFTVTLNPSSAQTVSVGFGTADGTAVAGVDYSPVSQTVAFSPGQVSQTVSVQLLGNPSGKRFYGQLSSPSGAPLWINQANATIP